VTSMQQDLGLGNVTSVLWLDKFFACQFLLVLLSLQMTVIVHRLASHHQQALAKHTDNVTTVAMPFLIYPVVTLGTLLIGLAERYPSSDTYGIVVLFVGTPLSLLYVAWQVYHNIIAKRAAQVNVISAFRKAAKEVGDDDDEATQRFEKASARLLYAFDIDGSGLLDEEEMLELVCTTYADVPVKDAHAACLEARKFAGQDGRYGVLMFQEAIAEINEALCPLSTKKMALGTKFVGVAIDPVGQLVGSALVKPGKDLKQGLGRFVKRRFSVGCNTSQTAKVALVEDPAATPPTSQAAAGRIVMRPFQPSRGAGERTSLSAHEEIGRSKPCTPSGELPSPNGTAPRRRFMDNAPESQQDGRGLRWTTIQVLEQATNVDEGMHDLLATDPETFYLHGNHIRKMLEYRLSGSVALSTSATSSASVAKLQSESGGSANASTNAKSAAETVAKLLQWPDFDSTVLTARRQRTGTTAREDTKWPDLLAPANGWR